MPIWTFVGYVELAGRNPVAEWLASEVPPEARTAINNRFLQMAGSTRWPDKWVSDYQGYPSIFEARIPWNKVQYRPLFMYSTTVRRQIVLLTGAIERGGKLVPRAAMDTASARRETLIGEPNVSHGTDLIRQELWESLQDKARRDAFVASHLSNNVGSQIFSLRGSRGWSQERLATEVGMVQPRISVLEGGYDSYSLRTLKRIASAFDVAVVVRFVPFSELVDWVVTLSEERLAPNEFANDDLANANRSGKEDGAGVVYAAAPGSDTIGGIMASLVSTENYAVATAVTDQMPYARTPVSLNDVANAGTVASAQRPTYHPRPSVALVSPW